MVAAHLVRPRHLGGSTPRNPPVYRAHSAPQALAPRRHRARTDRRKPLATRPRRAAAYASGPVQPPSGSHAWTAQTYRLGAHHVSIFEHNLLQDRIEALTRYVSSAYICATLRQRSNTERVESGAARNSDLPTIAGSPLWRRPMFGLLSMPVCASPKQRRRVAA